MKNEYIVISEANSDDIEFVHTIIIEAFSEYIGHLNPPSGALSETVESIKKKIDGKGGAIVAYNEAEPVGSAIYYYQDHYMYIGRVSVTPQHRGKGIGSVMIRYLEQLALKNGYAEARVEVRHSIPDNISIYEKLDYTPIQERISREDRSLVYDE